MTDNEGRFHIVELPPFRVRISAQTLRVVNERLTRPLMADVEADVGQKDVRIVMPSPSGK